MPFQPMEIQGAFVFTPVQHQDSRGNFQENFKLSALKDQLGLSFHVKQVNQSSSAKGVIRGIHFTNTPNGQAKYVSCLKGAIWDVVVDLRIGSPTFGRWDGVELSMKNGKSILIEPGLGHAFLSLEADSVVSYLCSEEYDQSGDVKINPLDPEIAIDFSKYRRIYKLNDFILSHEDSNAQSLSEALGDNQILRREN